VACFHSLPEILRTFGLLRQGYQVPYKQLQEYEKRNLLTINQLMTHQKIRLQLDSTKPSHAKTNVKDREKLPKWQIDELVEHKETRILDQSNYYWHSI